MTESLSSTHASSFRALFDRVEALFEQGERALAKEQFDLAEYFFQAAHSKDPENLALSLEEGKLWHRYALILKNPTPFKKAYKAYRLCFKHEELRFEALFKALELKLSQFEIFRQIHLLYEAQHLIAQIAPSDEKLFIEARINQEMALHYKDPDLFKKALHLFHEQFQKKPSSLLSEKLADTYKAYFELTQNPAHLIEALNYRKYGLETDGALADCLIKLAEDYKSLYYLTRDESCIAQFQETLSTATALYPTHLKAALLNAEGLVTMGIDAGSLRFVKLGIEKCHDVLSQTSDNPKTDVIIARGLSFLGQVSDKLSPIYEAFDKLKDTEDNQENIDLVLANYSVLLALFHYFQDIDYGYQAIEKLQEALSFNNAHRELWVEMGKAYYTVAKLDHNPSTLELSLRFLSKALNFYICPEVLLLKATVLSRLGELRQNPDILEESIVYFESALSMNKLLFQPKNHYLFQYAKTLDLKGNFHEEESYYLKAIDILTQLLMLDPLYPELHHQLALVQFHLGDLSADKELIKKSLSHFKLACIHRADDSVYIDWAIACIALSEITDIKHEAVYMQHEASHKLKKALKGGHVQAYYFMACLCALSEDLVQAMELLKIAERYEALPSAEDLLADEWLSHLRELSEFKKLVERQEMKRF